MDIELLRLECLKLAVKPGHGPQDAIRWAEQFEGYLLRPDSRDRGRKNRGDKQGSGDTVKAPPHAAESAQSGPQ